MRKSAIRQLAVSCDSARLAAACFEKTVQVWDLTTREQIKEFETVFYFGGNRLAIDAVAQRCVTAGWNKGKRGGVACYETDTGKLMWHRKDLRHTQRVRFSPIRNAFWCVKRHRPGCSYVKFLPLCQAYARTGLNTWEQGRKARILKSNTAQARAS